MGVDVGKENSETSSQILKESGPRKMIYFLLNILKDFNQYRRDIEKIKNLMMIRSYNPLYWNTFIWNLTSHGRLEKTLISRMHKFTHELIRNRLEEYRGMSSLEIEDISNQYSSGKIKRKLALLDTMMFALGQKELT